MADLPPLPTIDSTNPWGGHVSIPHPQASTLNRPSHWMSSSPLDIGILKSTLLPSLSLNSSLAVVAYTAGRLTDRAETKNLLWPVLPVVNAWHAAVLRHTAASAHGASDAGESAAAAAWRALSGPERMLLGGVTLWGARLLHRLASRSLSRGRDDPRYELAKRQRRLQPPPSHAGEASSRFWNWAWLTVYLPEVLFQTVIALPVTMPFRLAAGDYRCGMGDGYRGVGQALAVGLFGAGFALEVLADWQLAEFKMKAENRGKICRGGVWGIVRHPNYLGDALVHLSFPLLLYANNLLPPLALLGPLANYLFLRFVGGVKENEKFQVRRYSSEDVGKKMDFDRYRREKNAFWPDASQVYNKWAWIIVGCGVAGAVIERVVTRLL
ncbi:Lamin-B receptor [Madurella mycetomatis]|uniref:Lamin-B receptor n=1 Tax=Madurella mycetomatis TaxID=100816 RepID=A0A175W6J6_9PEZI|nr:Lamin-B receptor [Madurella mycetomatis]